MKLAPLLAQYLFNQKKLDLPGIGTFTLDSTTKIDPDSKQISGGIRFADNASAKEDEQLVSYISAQTGKMKALASSDFSSYLDLAKEFLNIGKPFLIEGIGTLVKTKSGHFDFVADHLMADKLKEAGIKELSTTSTSDESFTTYENLKPKVEKRSPLKNVFIIGLILATTVIVIYVGYRVYKKNAANAGIETEATTNVNTVPVTDSTNLAVSRKPENPGVDNGNYRFVIEVAKKKRALYRYDMLRKSNVPVQMSTADSVTYKLFFVIHALPSDTARISDSLSIFYPAVNKKKAFAEKQ